MSLDEFVKLDNVAFPNHIKIDVDGHEMTIVENMQQVLNDRRLKSVCIEIAKELYCKGIDRLLIACGFEVYITETWGDEGREIENVVFTRRGE